MSDKTGINTNMKNYILLSYCIIMFMLTTSLLILLYPHVKDNTQKFLYCYLVIAGYLASFISYKSYKTNY